MLTQHCGVFTHFFSDLHTPCEIFNKLSNSHIESFSVDVCHNSASMSHQPVACRHFAFRSNADVLSKAEMYQYLSSVSRRAVFELVVDGADGIARVWRGHLESARKTRTTTLLNSLYRLLKRAIPSGVHLEACAAGIRCDYMTLSPYSSALSTRVEGPYFLSNLQPVADDRLDSDLQPFEKCVLASVTSPTVDHIYCVEATYSPASLGALVERQKKGIYIPGVFETSTEIIQFVDRMLEIIPNPQVIVCELLGTHQWRKCRDVLSVLELLKVGVLPRAGPLSRRPRFNPPHVWVFTRCFPDTRFLCPEMWCFMRITNDESRGFKGQRGSQFHLQQEERRANSELSAMGDEDTRWFGCRTGSYEGRSAQSDYRNKLIDAERLRRAQDAVSESSDDE
jgi:hypothetical protein